MAYFGITATEAGLEPARPGVDLESELARGLAGVSRKAPVVVLIHGYKFHPGLPDADPHRSLFAFRPEEASWKIRSWPEGLGFADDGGETGLCIGFAWPASAGHLASLVTTGRNGFAGSTTAPATMARASRNSWRSCSGWRRGGRST